MLAKQHLGLPFQFFSQNSQMVPCFNSSEFTACPTFASGWSSKKFFTCWTSCGVKVILPDDCCWGSDWSVTFEPLKYCILRNARTLGTHVGCLGKKMILDVIWIILMLCNSQNLNMKNFDCSRLNGNICWRVGGGASAILEYFKEVVKDQKLIMQLILTIFIQVFNLYSSIGLFIILFLLILWFLIIFV